MKSIKFIVGVLLMFVAAVFLTACGGGGSSAASVPTPQAPQPQITSFNFTNPSATGSINNTNNTIVLIVSFATDVTNLTPAIAVSTGSTVSPTSGTSENFTGPVVYTVTAQDGVTTQKYVVTVVTTNVSSTLSILLNDDFTGTIVDASNWHIPTWVSSTDGTFVGQTQFRCTQNAPLPAAIDDSAIIALDTYNPTGQSFYGTDLITNQLLNLGQGIIYTVRAKFNAPIPAGIIGGIFLYYPPTSNAGPHDEIDFELYSNDLNNIYTNIYGSEPLGTGHPESYPYPSGSATDYHTYQILWQPNQVSWYVDGNLIRTVTTQSPIPVGPMYGHLNIWVPDSSVTLAYNANLLYTTSPSLDQTFSMSVDSVVIFAVTN